MFIEFSGSISAELFTRQLKESIAGTMRYNLIADEATGFPRGFVRASQPGYVWDDTCWTRDCGAYLRELALYGFTDEAAMIARYLMSHVVQGDEGYYSFPTFFKANEVGSGNELDGTCAICIGLISLHDCTDSDEIKHKIEAFLLGGRSPLLGILARDGFPLVAGSGEFGGGWNVDGLYINVVQNAMLVAALLLFAHFSEPFDATVSKAAASRADEVVKALPKYMTAADGGWIWTIDPASYAPVNMDGYILARNTAMINGVAPALFDGLGRRSLDDPGFAARCKQTANRIINSDPLRRRLYQKFGMIGHVHEILNGSDAYVSHTSWLGYCDGFFAETAVLLKDREALTRSLNWITAATMYGGNPPSAPNDIFDKLEALPDDSSRYWFCERNFAPDWDGERPVGCGALNLIHVAECMRLARMMAGLRQVQGTPEDKPFLPYNWSVTIRR